MIVLCFVRIFGTVQIVVLHGVSLPLLLVAAPIATSNAKEADEDDDEDRRQRRQRDHPRLANMRLAQLRHLLIPAAVVDSLSLCRHCATVAALAVALQHWNSKA